jgi:hypothetical protein
VVVGRGVTVVAGLGVEVCVVEGRVVTVLGVVLLVVVLGVVDGRGVTVVAGR